MIKTLVSVDVNKSAKDQSTPLHNRWHPDIPPVHTVEPGTIFRMECLDWTGGQIKNNDNANDVRDVDLTQVHYLSGPIGIKGAKPGDLLVVDILDLGALPSSPWGFTGIFDRTNGGGFLTEYFPKAAKAIWDIEGIYTSSRHIKNVRFPGIIHAGLIGTAPSAKLLAQWTKRELELFKTDPKRVPALTTLPEKKGALAGALKGAKAEKVKAEGARTVPGRENGGNCDIKNLTRGSRAYFPVFVDGANLSMGDMHFSQGDGEISFCGAIEMAGWLELKVDVIKDGMKKYGVTTNPIFQTSPLEPKFEKYITFEGISVDQKGKQHYLDPYISYKNACLNAIEYLTKFGYTKEQAYILLSTAPVDGRISGIVDIPNAVTTVYIPTSIFDFDITPSPNGATKKNRGDVAHCKK